MDGEKTIKRRYSEYSEFFSTQREVGAVEDSGETGGFPPPI